MNKQKQKLLKYIPARNKAGAIIRTTDNVGRLPLLEKAIKQLLTIDKIDLIHVMIHLPKEENGIWLELVKIFGKERKRIQLERINQGNFYGDLLNFAKNEQIRRGIDYSISISPEAYLYATEENIQNMLEAAELGSYATALNINEYKEFINLGYISNAFCMYRNSIIDFADIWNLNATFTAQVLGENEFGLEEIYIAKQLIDNYGKNSITVITPTTGTLIESEDLESIKKREVVKKTKIERFEKMCKILQVDAGFFQKNIIWK